MTLIEILSTLLIGPLKLVFEIIFDISHRLIGHPGFAIIMLSMVMNILVLPLYRRADAVQEKAKEDDERLRDGVAHIKKSFSGDERMMILQTYYRQNNYKPTSALNGSVSLLLEVPFFMAAYQFLSNLTVLNGVSLGPITDLGSPDGLLVIGGVALNFLPILMTLVNVVSSAIYLKGYPLKTKLQLYGMALFFLVFLYDSPSCLVFYWTLNNVFSLVKNIFCKLKHPQKIMKIATTILGVGCIIFGAVYKALSLKRKVFIIAAGIVLLVPLLLSLIKVEKNTIEKEIKPSKKAFILACIVLTVFVGLLIPSTYIAASPQEFVDFSYYHNPLWYIVRTVCMSAGTFLVWMGVFYWLANDKWKVVFERITWIAAGVVFVNYMFFGTNLGNISATLKYDNGLVLSSKEQLINIVVLAVVIAVMYIIHVLRRKVTMTILLTAFIAIVGLSSLNMFNINKTITGIKTSAENGESNSPNFNLSKNGKNVVVIMLDRAYGGFVPYILNEKPELKEKFSGFTHYANTVSFGAFTNVGSPPLLGGYEYTPVEMNKRSDELLVDKHNEALKVMPLLFSENDYEVTVCDPVYANYQWIPDLSIYDEYPEIDAYITNGAFGNTMRKQAVIDSNYRNFFCFSIMKSMPLFVQGIIYDGGQYNQCAEMEATVQIREGISKATGINATFENAYSALESLENMTNITDEGKNTYMLMTNDTTHEMNLMQTPDYTLSANVDNTEYDEAHKDRFIVDGKELVVEDEWQMCHYHMNMSAFLALGKWFDYLKAEGVYDNTRIILTADHGIYLDSFEDFEIEDFGYDHYLNDIAAYNPLFMVKDFGATEFSTSYEFMTNADVPTIAMEDIIENPVNPFTNKPINSDEKNAHEQFVMFSDDCSISTNNGTTFLPSQWMSVKENMLDSDYWTFYPRGEVLKEHRMNK